MRMRSVLVSVLALTAAVAAGVHLASAAMQLKLNHQMAANTVGSQIDQWFADEVARRTGNEVQIKIFWSEALGKAKENLQLVKDGAVDLVAMSPGYFPAQLPFFSAPNSLPMAMDNLKQADRIIKAFLEKVPAFEEEARASGLKPLFFHHLNAYLLICKEPVRSFADLKGRKIRTWGEDMPRLMQAAGATPVTMFLPELYENLQRGVIDCAPFAVDWIQNYKTYEVAKYITEVTVWQGPTWGVWMNARKWDALSEPHKKIVLAVAEEANQRDLKAVADAEEKARAFLKQQGVQFIPFPETERRKWIQASPDFFADWIAKMEKLGKGAAARQTVAMWKELREKYQ
jgi:TRAP-type C4-dicarboxylate transport system substrate-binding protein